MEQYKTMIQEQMKKYIAQHGNRHILIHSDVLFALKIKFESQEQYLEDHFMTLSEICGSLSIIMPSFNYEFCKGPAYSILVSESQVGTLSEYFRKHKAHWRSATPVFNFSGTETNPLPNTYGKTDPFDDLSLFCYLHKNNGLLLHYGSGIHTTTLIHYVERISNRLIYRYNKVFSGQVIDTQNISHDCKLVYHVRPLNHKLDYNWQKIERDLIAHNIIDKYKEKRTQIIIGRIDRIVEFWLMCIQADPFYFLDAESRIWVEQKYRELDRPFIVSDFEG